VRGLLVRFEVALVGIHLVEREPGWIIMVLEDIEADIARLGAGGLSIGQRRRNEITQSIGDDVNTNNHNVHEQAPS
jgi:hypothetical protein